MGRRLGNTQALWRRWIGPLAGRRGEAGKSKLRVDVYVIDSGWQTMAHTAVAENRDMMKHYLADHNLYFLSHEQSTAFLKRHPKYIGRDPILVAICPKERRKNSRQGYGVALVLGRLKWVLGIPDHHSMNMVQYVAMIKMFVRIINGHDGTRNLARPFASSTIGKDS